MISSSRSLETRLYWYCRAEIGSQPLWSATVWPRATTQAGVLHRPKCRTFPCRTRSFTLRITSAMSVL